MADTVVNVLWIPAGLSCDGDSVALTAAMQPSIEEIPLIIFCEFCEAERAPLPGTGLVCPECARASPRIVRGREMQLVSMEVPA